ncbi:tetratricopeptide repeat protein [Streptomyces sp. NBC_00247]|uniref:AfsR/SARP family transcriptional regulator n=1 Tax=Streptomyces sp. NBC_00247 TaxID=2975689 RepID=UPI002E2C0C6C|nr:BTAD domain-containing putative transcriptional regulator [Streptomyces sp. NBC_00247]
MPLQGARQRTLMSMLLLAPDRVVSVDALAEAVWDGSPPATARNQLAICVSALRKTFKKAAGLDGILVTSHPGYMLSTGEHRIDASEFERSAMLGRDAAREGRVQEACARFQDALAMWRGPALEGVMSGRVEAEAGRLDELRCDIYEEYAGLRIGLGQHQEILGELASFTLAHPLREQAIAHLMLAQYRSGRRAEALGTYCSGRTRLAEELGIDPGPALQELYELILADAPQLGAPSPAVPAAGGSTVPSQLPAELASFTGRREEVALLDPLLGRLGGGALPVGFVVGAGGVGKTALAVRWAHQVADRFPGGQLFADLRGYDEEEAPRRPSAVLDGFLRALGVAAPQIPTDQNERADLFRGILVGRRVLIVLDNARSFSQIRSLLPGAGHCCVLVTGRDAMAGALAGDYAVESLNLGALDEYEAVSLLARVAGDGRLAADPVGAARIVQLCDGLPLALRIAAARLAAKPHWSVGTLVRRLQDQRRRLDELSPDERGVRASLRLSYRYLAPGAARMFRLLGLLSVPDFAAWAGAALLDIEPAEAEDLVEELVDAQLLEPLSAGSDGQVRYRFQELPRLFARECANAEESEDDRRGAVRRAYGGWFGLAREAHRRVYGGNFTVVRNPSAPHPLPARLVDTPVGWFETERASIAALVEQASQDDGAGSYAWGLTSLSVTFFQSGNYLEDWRRCAELSLEAVRRDGDPLGEAVMLHSLSTLEIVQWDHDGARERQRLALELFEKLGERQGCALVLRNMAMCERHQGEPDRAAVIGREALENFRSVGDLYGEAYMLGLLAQIELERGEAAASLELSAEAIVRGRALGSGRGEAQSSVRLAEALTRLGEAAKAEKACRRALELVRESGDVRGEAHALRALGEALWGQGRTAEAESVLLEGLSVACEVPDRFLEGRAAAVLGCLLALRGDKPGAVDRLRTAARLFAEVGAGSRWRERAETLLAAVDTGGPEDANGTAALPDPDELFALVKP